MKKERVVFLIFVCITIISSMYFLVASGSESSSTSEWLMFHRNLNQTGVYPGSVNISNFSLIWNYSTGNDIVSSPIVYKNKVYFGSVDDNVYALNATNGTQIWNYTFSGGANALTSSPAIANDILYIGGTNSDFYALNATNGTQIWNYSIGGDAYVMVGTIVASDVVYFGSLDKRFYALNATNGTQIWNYTAPSYFRDFSPAIANDIVYVTQGLVNYNYPFIYALNATNGTQIWNYTADAPTTASSSSSGLYSPAIANDIVYVPHGQQIFALNATNGGWIWNYSANAGNYFSSPVYYNDIIYAGETNDAEGKVYALNATNGTLLWTYQDIMYNSQFSSSAILADDVLFIGSNNRRFYAINITEADLAYRYDAAFGNFQSSPAIADGIVYIGCNDGNLYAFSNTTAACVEIWTCGDWGTCTNNVQTRNCRQWNGACANFTRLDSVSCTPESESGGPSSTSVITSKIITHQSYFETIKPQQPAEININQPNTDLTKITISTNSEVKGASVKVTQTDTTLQDGITGETYQSFKIEKTKLNSTNIKDIKFDFKVNKSWVEEKNGTASDINLYRQEDNSTGWTVLNTSSSGEDENYFYFTAMSPGFSTFVIFLSEYECTPGNVRCFDGDVQLCVGNSTWLITESCDYACSDGKCAQRNKMSLVIYPAIITGISIFILITVYILLKRILKKRKHFKY